MVKNKECFIEYIKKLDLYTEGIETAFEAYFEGLVSTNKRVNLFSRKMEIDDIWIKHFIDSVSIFEVFTNWAGKKVLDFGTGGGLPGIPIKIIAPSCEMTLLDSTKKKLQAVREIIDVVVARYALPNADSHFGLSLLVQTLTHRLEDKEMDAYNNYFDIIVCRSVKITPVLQKAMFKVLKKKGKIFLYKSIDIDDVKLFKKYKEHKLDIKVLGERRIIEINYG